MAEQRNFVDFNQGLGDTGQDNITSIQPLNDGEGATQVVLRRPTENLRERTEILREQVAELQYYRDYSHLMIEYSGGSITWNGTTLSPNGKIDVNAGNFIIRPMLAPSVAKKGSLTVGTTNQVIYTVANQAYAVHGMNSITVRHVDAGIGATASVTISDGPVKRITVFFDSANAAHTPAAIKTLLDTAIGTDTALTGKLNITTSGTGIVEAAAEKRLEGTADDESHHITATHIRDLTTATPLTIRKGIAIWYRYLVEPAGFTSDPKGGVDGGRAESTASRTSPSNVLPAASLFVTDENPEKIPGAIPLCRVTAAGQLVWYDGTRQESGETITFASTTSVAATLASNAQAAAISSANSTSSAALAAQVAVYANQTAGNGASLIGYAGGAAWKNGTTNPATTVENQLDKIITDLVNTTSDSGAAKLGVRTANHAGALTVVGAGGLTTAADNIQTAIDEIDNALVARRAFTAVLTNGSASTGGDYNTNDLFANINTIGTSGTFMVRRGTYNATVDLTSHPKLYRIIGEAFSLVSILNSTAGDLQFTGLTTRYARQFEQLYFSTTIADSPNRYIFKGGSVTLHRCSFNTGQLSFELADGGIHLDVQELFMDENLDNAFYPARARDEGLLIQGSANLSMRGAIRLLRMTIVPGLNAATTAKYGIKINDLITSSNDLEANREALLFENCQIRIGGGMDAGGGAALGIYNSHQPMIFKGCNFEIQNVVGVQETAAATLLDISASANIVFEDCSFIQSGSGKTLTISGDSYNIQFRNCKFYTSNKASSVDEFNVTSTAINRKPVTFKDCHLDIRFGNGLQTRRVQFGRLGTSGTSTGTGAIEINGMYVRLTYAHATSIYVNDRLFTFDLGATTNNSLRSRVNNLHIDLNSKIPQQPSSVILGFIGFSKMPLPVTGLNVYNVSSPDAAATTSHVMALTSAGITGMTITGSTTNEGSEAWTSLLLLNGDNSYCDSARFWVRDVPARGRLIRVNLATGCRITNNEVVITTPHAGDTPSGWFLTCNNKYTHVSGNRVQISNSFGTSYLDAVFNFNANTSASDSSTVVNNIVQFFGTGYAFNVTGNYLTVTGNTVSVNSGSNIDAVRIGGTKNVVTSNTVVNVDGTGTAAILDNGALNTVNNNTTD